MSGEGKITYTSMSTDPELRAEFDGELARVAGAFPRVLEGGVSGRPLAGAAEHRVVSPIDTRWRIARFPSASPEEVGEAVAAATAAFPEWRDRPWEERCAILHAAADGIGARRLELAAWMVYEVGKSRLEALAEVEESADLLRYYARRMEENQGFRRVMARMSPDEATESVMRPYGVWTVISPFNFPSALAAGMIGGALVTGNTVVFKPSVDAPISGELLCRELWAAGVPGEVLQLLHGTGERVGRRLLADPRIAGFAFTGSSAVGLRMVRQALVEWPRPVVVEMGGKNPAIVTASADLDAAADGVARSAFGFGGQKCSACSRVYVERRVARDFFERLLARTRALTVGNPVSGDPFLGPVIHAQAVENYRRYVAGIASAGGEIVTGGEVLTQGNLAHGFYVAPTLARLPDPRHPYFAEEMFLPILLWQEVGSLEEAIVEANAVPYGLTAGIFTRDRAELEAFLSGIEAGVLYANRRSGATTGAWPGVNSFGGWKASGACGPAALGPDYLLKFLREQSRAVSGFAV